MNIYGIIGWSIVIIPIVLLIGAVIYNGITDSRRKKMDELHEALLMAHSTGDIFLENEIKKKIYKMIKNKY